MAYFQVIIVISPLGEVMYCYDVVQKNDRPKAISTSYCVLFIPEGLL